MTNRFIIYSTPRSGSAWLSNFLTTDGILCLHEPLAYADPSELPALLGNRVHAGIADTLACEVRGELSKLGWREFALVRSGPEVLKSLGELGLPNGEDMWKPQLDLPTIEYDKLFDVDYLEGIWGIIIGDGFDRQRAEMLIDLRVEHDLAKLGAQMENSEWLMSRYST